MSYLHLHSGNFLRWYVTRFFPGGRESGLGLGYIRVLKSRINIFIFDEGGPRFNSALSSGCVCPASLGSSAAGYTARVYDPTAAFHYPLLRWKALAFSSDSGHAIGARHCSIPGIA